jgi:hypothetical protein
MASFLIFLRVIPSNHKAVALGGFEMVVIVLQMAKDTVHQRSLEIKASRGGKALIIWLQIPWYFDHRGSRPAAMAKYRTWTFFWYGFK